MSEWRLSTICAVIEQPHHRCGDGYVIFCCLVNALISEVIREVLVRLTDDLSSTSVDLYLLKVYSLSEYLIK